MKIKEGFILREVAGNYVVIACGDDVLDFNSVITVNELGSIIWNGIEDGKNKTEIIDLILSEYDIDKDTASSDFDEFVTLLKSQGIIIE